jgi:Fic family protein
MLLRGMFAPNFTISPRLSQALLLIETLRMQLAGARIDAALLQSLRATALLASTHFSTFIEGNRLTLPEVLSVSKGASFPDRRRDEIEVRNHFKAVEYMEKLAELAAPLRESEVQSIHGLVLDGRNRATPYRSQQNVIRDSGSGRIVYLPPEPQDVPLLMTGLIEWVNIQLEARQLPVPLIAGLAHYQFATVHPYLDGNGRTARLLATLILRRAGFGLQGIYSLDEHYANNLGAYYSALTIGSHNYYQGRAQADLTNFLTYFCEGMAEAFVSVGGAVSRAAVNTGSDHSALLRELGARQRKLLPLFSSQGSATSKEMAGHLSLGSRTLTQFCREWVKSGFLEFDEPSRKSRSYRIGTRFLPLLD